MIDLYKEKGLSEAAAKRLFEIISPHRKVFVDMMMVNELGILPEEEEDIAWKHGAVNFASFFVFGIVPLIGYIVFIVAESAKPPVDAFGVSIALTGCTLFMMGIFKGRMTGTNWVRSGFVTVLFGSIGAIVGWLTSFILNEATGTNIS
jgi:vacuolar iron transporter family protein